MEEKKVNRNYKDNMFRMLFNDRKAMISLFNAVNGTVKTTGTWYISF